MTTYGVENPQAVYDRYLKLETLVGPPHCHRLLMVLQLKRAYRASSPRR